MPSGVLSSRGGKAGKAEKGGGAKQGIIECTRSGHYICIYSACENYKSQCYAANHVLLSTGV